MARCLRQTRSPFSFFLPFFLLTTVAEHSQIWLIAGITYTYIYTCICLAMDLCSCHCIRSLFTAKLLLRDFSLISTALVVI